MPVSYPYTQYSGTWTLSQASDAVAQGKWPSPPALHLYAWGQGGSGQLGLGNTTYYSSPVQVGSLTTWSKLTTSNSLSLAVKTDGTLWSWGYNGSGGLGLGNRTNYSSPKQVGALTNWSQVSCNSNASLAIKTDGTLWSWGYNSWGQLGTGNLTYYSSPVQVGSLTNWAKISQQSASSLAIKTDGTLWIWGSNSNGQLGDNTLTDRSSPVQTVTGGTNWSVVACGRAHTAAIKTDGTLWAWGRNDGGQLGDNTTTNKSSFQTNNL